MRQAQSAVDSGSAFVNFVGFVVKNLPRMFADMN